MKLIWQIDGSDVELVQKFVEARRTNVLVQRRTERNLNDAHPFPTREEIWKTIIACLLTTREKSGPTSSVTRFMLLENFPFSLGACSPKFLRSSAAGILAQHGKPRRANLIAGELSDNLEFLETDSWVGLEKQLRKVYDDRKVETERSAVQYIDSQLRGFGPKQSRNLLQALGISRFEIPIDSRITNWLNGIGFPLRLSSKALADANYYEFIMDGIQQLCLAAGVLPCILDAAIFASYDGNGWNESNAIW